jgi:hypothetical protein
MTTGRLATTPVDTAGAITSRTRIKIVAASLAFYPTHLQQIQTKSTNPAPPNVLLPAHNPIVILSPWRATQQCWDVGFRSLTALQTSSFRQRAIWPRIPENLFSSKKATNRKGM